MEIWKDVSGYEGKYLISNNGKVRRVDSGKLKKPTPDKDGYLRVDLYKDGVRKKFGIHQLVANEFVEKSYENLVVNHIDENKTNNIYSNLEWVSVKDNTNHGTAIIRRAMTQGKKVRQLLANGEFVNEFYSTGEAERQTGIDHSYISMCANGKVRTAKGYIWEYV